MHLDQARPVARLERAAPRGLEGVFRPHLVAGDVAEQLADTMEAPRRDVVERTVEDEALGRVPRVVEDDDDRVRADPRQRRELGGRSSGTRRRRPARAAGGPVAPPQRERRRRAESHRRVRNADARNSLRSWTRSSTAANRQSPTSQTTTMSGVRPSFRRPIRRPIFIGSPALGKPAAVGPGAPTGSGRPCGPHCLISSGTKSRSCTRG